NQYIYRFDVSSQYLYKPYKYSEVELSASAFYYFRNFWDVTFSVSSYPFAQHDYFELRTPGLFVKRPAEVTFGMNGSTDSRKRFYVGYGLGVATRPNRVDNGYNSLQLFFRYRFSDQFTMNVSWGREYESNQIGYAFARENNGDPILGYRDFTETATLLSGIYNFTPRLNVSLRARHYWNKVIYNSFYNVDAKGDHIPRSFLSGRDENYNGFNVDAFLTWDFRPGSRVILGYKNWLGDNYSVNGTLFNNYTDNLERTFRTSHGNELTLKVIYFLDYNQLRKKH
ncbi:MAG TPA: DUF5916 domain-containing protein, partial [Flavisolibacter sp.]|nr:DUF5916 domain-containing protein [Flavisolibacter sp.]